MKSIISMHESLANIRPQNQGLTSESIDFSYRSDVGLLLLIVENITRYTNTSDLVRPIFYPPVRAHAYARTRMRTHTCIG